MAENYIAGLEIVEDENGMKLISFGIRNRKKKNYFGRLMNDGIQIISGAALAACSWKLDLHPMWPLGLSALVIEGAVHFYRNIRKFYRKLTYLQREKIYLSSLLATGTLTYFATVAKFSTTLKQNDKLWIIYLGAAVTCYYLSVSSNNKLEGTILNWKPVFKCWQLLFGPTLIGSAAYYLLCLQKHDEEWLRCLPLIACAAAANHISFTGYRRVESNNEPRWLLFKGLELLVGGSILYINGAVLVVYAVKNQFHPVLILLFTTMIFHGVTDISNSLKSFQGCVEMEAPVFYCICDMIGGPMIFLSACLSFGYVHHPIMLPTFIVIAGTGLAVLGKSVIDLHDLVPRPVFNRYCQRVLGPVATMYSSLVSAYLGYRMGWKFSLVMIPAIPAGIYATYRGWK